MTIAAYCKCAVRVAPLGLLALIALFPLIPDCVAAVLQTAVRAAWGAGRSIKLAIVACFRIWKIVNNSITTCFVRFAISTTPVTISDIAVVADFTGLDNTVATAADVNAYRLTGSTDLPGRAIQAKVAAGIRQSFAQAL